MPFRFLVACLILGFVPASLLAQATLKTDLLVVGGTEAACAAALQAARCGVKSIVLVNDCTMLGGQFSAEGVGAIDEWTTYRGKRVEFPRSGIFQEVIEAGRRMNGYSYGHIRPGNGFCASETIEPGVANVEFTRLLQRQDGKIRIIEGLRPAKVNTAHGAVRSVEFEAVFSTATPVKIEARLTIDATDWGDVIRLSGAKYSAGPDLRQRFQEPNAPEGPLDENRHEMNPISYCLVLKGTNVDATIPKPAGYDERTYFGTTNATTTEFKQLQWPPKAQQMNVPPFINTAYPEGIYSAQVNLYAHRRLVDARHLGLDPEEELILVNWPTQDYPLYDFPQRVIDQLEANERGASLKNIVDMSYRQREIVFHDAKQHALGMLYHLQTTVQAKLDPKQVDFRKLSLVTDFGTPDRLPQKPYVREGLRLEALYMLREGDLRMQREEPRWARHMVPDSIFGFQFNIDFHPTRRIFLNDEPSDVWTLVHTKYRNWSTDTDRSMLPLRSLVPKQIDGLIVAGKNLGVSSIVQSAVRLHGHGMLAGQAAATVAGVALAANKQPRAIAADAASIRRVQRQLLAPRDAVARQQPPGVLLWPYQDLSLADPSFVAANVVAVEGVYFTEDGVPDFNAEKRPTPQELRRAVERMRTRIPSFQFSSPPKSRRDLVEALFAALERLER